MTTPEVAAAAALQEPGPSCRMCRYPMPVYARKCVHCDAYQDWRRYLVVSNTVLALLVALVSVLVVAFPLVKQALHRPNSEITVQLQNVTDEHVFLMVSNPGDRAGSLGRIEMKLINFKPSVVVVPVRVVNWLVRETFVAPGGTSQIDLFPERPLKLGVQEELRLSKARCQLVINTTEFSGNARTFTFEKPCEVFRDFLLTPRD